MTGRYALLAAALLAPGLAHAQGPGTGWTFVRKVGTGLAGADTAFVRPFLATTDAAGNLYFLSSRATDTLAHNALWKLTPSGTQATLVEDLNSDVNVNSVRGVTAVGSDIVVMTNTKPVPSGPGIGAAYVYRGGSAASREVINTGGYGTFPYGVATTKEGFVYAVLSFQTSIRVYDFRASAPGGYGKWISQDPNSVSEASGHDLCALSQLRDIAVDPDGDYTSTTSSFYTTRNATPANAPTSCTKYGGSVTLWSGATATTWQKYKPEKVTSLDGQFELSSYVAAGITMDKAGTLYLAGPDSARRFVKAYTATGTFAFEDATKSFPSATTPIAGESVSGGAPFRAPVDVAITPDETMAYVIDRDARAVFVFSKTGTGIADEAEASGLSLAAPGPNPVRGVTTLRFALREAGVARLSVVDALGREVARLVDGVTGGVEQRIAFDASALPVGLYLVRLEAAGATTTRTFVRVR